MRHRAEWQRRMAGQSLIEVALTLPLMILLILNVVNFAAFFYAFVEVGNASRSAGDYMIMGRAAYSGSTPSGGSGTTLTAASEQGSTGAQLVANMLATDMASLPNTTSIQVRVCLLKIDGTLTCNICSNTTGTMSCTAGSGSFPDPSADTSTGEGLNYDMTWVDVAYTYPALAPGFTFLNNTVLHRQAVYRVLN